MKHIKFNRLQKTLALITALSIINSSIMPTMVMALTSGPAQPEFSSFEPVATTNMVNEFTGDFTYNLPVLEVPGPHGSGYSMSLSYHSGTSPEEDASWVGYGWTLNAGAINRSVRGIPDEFKGQNVTCYNNVPENWTVTVGGALKPELFSFSIGELLKSTDVSANVNASLRYNNYRGFGYSAGGGVIVGDGMVDLGYNVSNGEGSFSLSVNPLASLDREKQRLKGKMTKDNHQQTKAKLAKLRANDKTKKFVKYLKTISNVELAGSNYGICTYGSSFRPSFSAKYEGISFQGNIGFLGALSFLPAGGSADLYGMYSVQKNVSPLDLNAYGYMYSGDAIGENSMMDYHIEKETPYNKRDVFLGIPFNGADMFQVTGQGLGGGFRLHHPQLGHFHPDKKKSKYAIGKIGGELEAGFNWGGGVKLGLGYHSLEVEGWEEDATSFSDAENAFLRFNNDQGGSWAYYKNNQANDDAIRAGLAKSDKAVQTVLGNKYFKPDLNGITEVMNKGQRPDMSSYIDYHTNKEINDAFANAKYKLFSLRQDIHDYARRTSSEDCIGEIGVINEEGMRYVYGLPVYSKQEKNMSYSASGITVEDNYWAASKNESKMKVGQEYIDGSYSSTFLLTEITTPDYIDRNLNGPDAQDFGGYTRFNYTRHLGGNGDWYEWASPYKGYLYSKNSLSDLADDALQKTSGFKEIYYLQSIETKTHAAIFHMNNPSSEARKDAKAENNKRLRYLKKISLYAISDVNRTSDGTLSPKSGAKPIKIIHFTYNYSLANGGDAQWFNSDAGKLTLKSVYFEYEGINKTRISPYRFQYAYPVNADYPVAYQRIKDQYTRTGNENPAYSPLNVDAWGHYQANGSQRHAAMQTWLDQNPPEDFDPAAWQLKVIQLPTGGEIHVQYEQDDYAYVQNKPAHIMLPLTNRINNKFFLDYAKAGLDPGDLPILKKMIKKRYIEKNNKIYFKFLYNLLGKQTPQPNSCTSEYIDGYVDVANVTIEGGSIAITLDDNNKKRLPEKVCREFLFTQRMGMIQEGNCSPNAGIPKDSGPIQLFERLIAIRKLVVPGSVCSEMNNQLSYFRVPMPTEKKGGGLRVKRLLMYDKGTVTPGDGVVYGNEYIYKAYDENTQTIRSSGVATNEPGRIREECILTDFIGREKQSLLNKIIAGRDKKQSEGPLGESIMPSPSVGYSRIAVRNIHTGKSKPTFNVTSFYTAKDYPVYFEKTGIKEKVDYLPLILGPVIEMINNSWVTQGFTFKLNDMHGKIKRKASYTGDYSDQNLIMLDNAKEVSAEKYEYYQPGEKIPVMTNYYDGIEWIEAGKETDITFASKAVKDDLKNFSCEVDGNVGILISIIPIPVPFVTGTPSYLHKESQIYTHVITKVVHETGVVKKMIQYQDEIKHITENIAYDKYTARPVITKSYDEFDGTYLKQNLPASWVYDQFKPIAQKQGNTIRGDYVLTDNYLDVSGSANACDLMSKFTKGDMIDIGNQTLFHIADFDYLRERIYVERSMQSIGNATTASSVTIVKSGRNNRLAEMAGEITLHSKTETIDYYEMDNPIEWTKADDFISALNNKISGISGDYGSFTMYSAKPSMNMSTYDDLLPEGANVRMDSVDVKNMEFIFYNEEGILTLDLMSFEVKDVNGNWIKID